MLKLLVTRSGELWMWALDSGEHGVDDLLFCVRGVYHHDAAALKERKEKGATLWDFAVTSDEYEAVFVV